MMTFAEYQKLALRTAGPKGEAILGIGGEVGELQNKYKKQEYHGHEFNDGEIAEELGDILWYVAVLAASEDVDLERLAVDNIKKLRSRYPNGFTIEDSVNRSKS